MRLGLPLLAEVVGSDDRDYDRPVETPGRLGLGV